MNKKAKIKSISIIVVILIIVIVTGFAIYKVLQNNNWKNASEVEDIIIKDSDSDDVKIQKIQTKIELINKDINGIQEKLNIELQKMNDLYEEYVEEMNQYQTGVPSEE